MPIRTEPALPEDDWQLCLDAARFDDLIRVLVSVDMAAGFVATGRKQQAEFAGRLAGPRLRHARVHPCATSSPRCCAPLNE